MYSLNVLKLELKIQCTKNNWNHTLGNFMKGKAIHARSYGSIAFVDLVFFKLEKKN